MSPGRGVVRVEPEPSGDHTFGDLDDRFIGAEGVGSDPARALNELFGEFVRATGTTGGDSHA